MERFWAVFDLLPPADQEGVIRFAQKLLEGSKGKVADKAGADA